MNSLTSPALNGVIIDTNVLSIFAKIDRLDLLHTLFRSTRSDVTLYLTPTILDEVKEGIRQGITYLAEVSRFIEVNQLRVLTLSEADERYVVQLPAKLAPGEAEAIALCHRLGYIFVTHDRKAANYCEREGIGCLRLTTLLDGLHRADKLTDAEILAALR